MALSRPVPAEAFEQQLRDLLLFDGVSNEGVKRLCELGRCHDYPRGNVLHYKGDQGAMLSLVLCGAVNLVLSSADGRDVVVDVARPGHMVGLLGYMDDGPQPTDAITSGETRLVRFHRDRFLAWTKDHPGVEERIRHSVADALRRAYDKIGEHALMSAKERLLITLLQIADHEGREDRHTDEVVFTRPTHEELASRIGSRREVVSRLLRDLLESDLLNADGKVIRVPASALVFKP